MKYLSTICSVLLVYSGLCLADDNKNEWRTYSSKAMKKYIFVTDDWSTFDDAKEASAPEFAFRLPPDWKLHGSVIYDKDEEKIAEWAPRGLIRLRNGQSCFDNYSDDNAEYFKKTRDKRSISLNGLTGQVMLQESVYEGGSGEHGVWYPQRFCISNGQFAFSMTFYQLKSTAEVNEEFSKVFRTFRFDQ